jgi:coenzyme PQQ biosynthesis protein C
MKSLLTPDALEAGLREIGERRYHDRHPFHIRMVDGSLTKGQLQAWALNRYYYQSMIPVKDAVILSKIRDPGLRRHWRQRLVDHDGDGAGEQGGISRWLMLADGVGLDRQYVASLAGLLPATRFAVDAYVQFCREQPLLDAIASSLTELFSPRAIGERTSAILARYSFVPPEALAYFKPRLSQAPRDADFALEFVKREARTPEQQQSVQDALTFKCDVLWAQLDALYFAYVEPGLPAPGAFVPEAAP